MTYQVDEQVVHAAFGVGRVVKVSPRRFTEAEAQLYYEISIERSTVWVPVSAPNLLRPLTTRADLSHYRKVLRDRPADLTADHRQRRQELADRLKIGLFQDLCEIVRDLAARGWRRPLSEMDSAMMRRARDKLCSEWAAAAGLSLADAAREVDELLRDGQRAHRK